MEISGVCLTVNGLQAHSSSVGPGTFLSDI